MSNERISATEANRQFSRLLRRVEGGARVTITKDGKPVAALVPIGRDGEDRTAARRRMLELLHEGLPLGFTGPLDRDELHTR